MPTPDFADEDFKRQLTATMLAESADGQEDKIRWIYYANTNKAKGLKGLEKSSAYKHKSDWFKVWLYLLGDSAPEKAVLPKTGPQAKYFTGFDTVGEYCKKNGWVQAVAKKRAAKARELVEAMYTSTNPYEGWVGQGNLNDFNNLSNKDEFWKMARAYYWLQVDKKVTEKFVEVLPAGKNTQFIFDAESIRKYFTSHQLPADVKLFTEGDIPK